MRRNNNGRQQALGQASRQAGDFRAQKGYEKLKEFIGWARDEGVQYLIVYAFSTENWNRGKRGSRSQLMKFLSLVVKTEQESLKKEGIKIKFIGELTKFSPEIQKNIAKWRKRPRAKKTSIYIWRFHTVGALKYCRLLKGFIRQKRFVGTFGRRFRPGDVDGGDA